jgi:branched-chain amino acid transport system substrate-binding protein
MSIKNLIGKYLLIFLSTLLLSLFSGTAMADVIKIGSLNDMTGATSDVGKDYAMGIAEAIHYVNENGGVNGKANQAASV